MREKKNEKQEKPKSIVKPWFKLTPLHAIRGSTYLIGFEIKDSNLKSNILLFIIKNLIFFRRFV